VFRALAARSVEWPADARKALDVPNLHLNVQLVLIEIAGVLVVNRTAIRKSMLASLRNRLNRYHPTWRD
jgi:hypothetical protein